MTANEGTSRLIVPVSDRDHVIGQLGSAVTLVEYGDYECSFCAGAQVVIKEIQKRMEDRLCFVFRHFPQSAIHPDAANAAEAAECAAAQGKFWDMHNHLLRHQWELGPADLVRHADALGLDLARFRQELEEHRHRARVEQDLESGTSSGVRATPTFFINGAAYQGSHQPEPLLHALRQAATAA